MSGGGGFWGFVSSFLRAFVKSAQDAQRTNSSSSSTAAPSRTTAASGRGSASVLRDARSAGDAEASPGQFGNGATRDLTRAEVQRLVPSYAPSADGDPDPGEIVWTWVPYAENDGRGKDRPVLIIARLDDGATAGCYLSTKEHRDFVSIGSGPWDSQGRESFLAPDRVLRVTEDGMRREGNVLARDRFDRAVTAVQRVQGIRA